jgi:hypothetical protein
MQRTPSVVLSFLAAASLIAAGCASSKGAGPSTSAGAGSTSAGASADSAGGPANVLTAEEQAAGWRLLFDGKTTKGWRGFKKPTFPEKGWRAEDGILKHEKNEEGFHAGDIVTDEQFDNFELTMDFKVTPRGNSGLKYLVSEEMGKPGTAVGFEYQILDDDLHPDAKKGKDGNRRCGGLYDLIAPPADKVLHPVGQWNQARLVVDGNNIEHWLNGKKTVAYVRGSPELKALIAESKFKDIAGFGETAKGHILLQDHNDEIGFRNIKVRALPPK